MKVKCTFDVRKLTVAVYSIFEHIRHGRKKSMYASHTFYAKSIKMKHVWSWFSGYFLWILLCYFHLVQKYTTEKVESLFIQTHPIYIQQQNYSDRLNISFSFKILGELHDFIISYLTFLWWQYASMWMIKFTFNAQNHFFNLNFFKWTFVLPIRRTVTELRIQILVEWPLT